MSAVTRADIVLHFRARTTFVNALYALPRVQAAVNELGVRLENVLLPHVDKIDDPIWQASDAAREMVCRYTVLPIEWAAALVDELKLPSPIRDVAGVDLALTAMAYAYDAVGAPLGVIVEYDHKRPPITYTYSALPNEPAADAQQRLLKEVLQVVIELSAAEPPEGWAPRDDGQAVERGVHWWVRHHVEGVSIRALSDAYVHERSLDGVTLDRDQRKTVRYGIRAAAEALTLKLPLLITWDGDSALAGSVAYLPRGLTTPQGRE